MFLALVSLTRSTDVGRPNKVTCLRQCQALRPQSVRSSHEKTNSFNLFNPHNHNDSSQDKHPWSQTRHSLLYYRIHIVFLAPASIINVFSCIRSCCILENADPWLFLSILITFFLLWIAFAQEYEESYYCCYYSCWMINDNSDISIRILNSTLLFSAHAARMLWDVERLWCKLGRHSHKKVYSTSTCIK